MTALLRRARAVTRDVREWRRATRDYRALCREGRAAHVQFSVRLHPDDDEWTGLEKNGVTGLKTVIPLTKAGRREALDTLTDIERTCIAAVLKANRDARKDPA